MTMTRARKVKTVAQERRATYIPAVVLFAVTFAVTAIVNPRFLGPVGMSNFFGTYLPMVLAAMAIAVVMLGGGIDLSIGATMSLVNVVFITLVGQGAPLVLVVLISFAAGLAVGALNALAVAVGRIPPLLATLGSMFVVSGLCLVIMPISSGSAPAEMIRAYASGVAFVPVTALVVVAALVIWYFFSKTKHALRLVAVGGDQKSAYATGLKVQWVVASSYLIGSGVAALAAFALTANVATGSPTIADTYTMNAIAAAVIGGVSLLGGSGSPIGAAFGALFLGLISNLILSTGVSSYYVSFATGAVVLAGIVFTSLLRSEVPGMWVLGRARKASAQEGSQK